MSSATRNCSELVPNWTPRQRPARAPLTGHWCTLEPLDPDLHAAQLHTAFAQDASGSGWTYLPYGPFADADSYADWMRVNALGIDPQTAPRLVELSVPAVQSASWRSCASNLRMGRSRSGIFTGHRFCSARRRRLRRYSCCSISSLRLAIGVVNGSVTRRICRRAVRRRASDFASKANSCST